MYNQFSDEMAKRTNAELLKIVTEQRKDYQPEAVAAADQEYAKRRLSQEELHIATVEVQQKKRDDEDRATEPLSMGWKLLAAIFPGFIFIAFSLLFKGAGEDRKARDLIRWTLCGVGFYVTFSILIEILDKLSGK